MKRIYALILIAAAVGVQAAETPKVELSQEKMRSMIVAMVAPEYPTQAAGLEGPVIVAVALNADGSILDADSRCGDARLRSAAVDAVRKWRFRAATLSGKPVQVHGDVVVDFEAPNAASDSTILDVKSQDALTHLVSSAPPIYPSNAAMGRIQGCVIVKTLVGINGKVISVKTVSGHPMLAPAAEVAAAQSRYTPFTKDGAVVQAETYQIINFSLRK